MRNTLVDSNQGVELAIRGSQQIAVFEAGHSGLPRQLHRPRSRKKGERRDQPLVDGIQGVRLHC